MKLGSLISMVFLLAFANACASQQAEAEKPAPQGSATGPQGSSNANAALRCVSSSGPINAAVLPGMNGTLDGNKISLFDESDRSRQTFCDVLLSSSKPVIIFQFAGALCLSCQEEAKYLDSVIRTSGKSNKIGHVVIITDYRDERRIQDINTFKSKFAPNAIYKLDDEQKLWTYLSPAKKFGTAVVLDRNGNTFSVADVGREKEVLQNADRMANGF